MTVEAKPTATAVAANAVRDVSCYCWNSLIGAGQSGLAIALNAGLEAAAGIIEAFGPLVERALTLRVDATYPAEAMFTPSASYDGATVIERLREYANASPTARPYAVVAIVNTPAEANDAIGQGWEPIGVAVHQNAAPEYHLGRRAS
jgi:hypothetical protein